ncbi:MAG TPA: Uma2 family endonuclease [Blastocatellia bacterium]|nr:Uma2 family endonuclease [Blastocatellia bacterium]
MSARQQDILRQVEYPESDGQPMGETDEHRQLMIDLTEALKMFFAADPNVYVSGNLMCYYEENNPKKSVSPDVFVVRGVANHERRIYKFWEEPAPQVVLEISSRKTRKEDFGAKKELYAWLGVREYFVFDPETNRRAPLRAFRLHGPELIEEVVTANRVVSQELGLELVNTGDTLRLYNPRSKEFLLTPAESYARAAEEAARAARLAAKLRELGVDPDHL